MSLDFDFFYRLPLKTDKRLLIQSENSTPPPRSLAKKIHYEYIKIKKIKEKRKRNDKKKGESEKKSGEREEREKKGRKREKRWGGGWKVIFSQKCFKG